MDTAPLNSMARRKPQPRQLIYRHKTWTRVTHWIWAVCLFFLLLSGLQIFNAHPVLYIGDQSGFGFDNTIFEIGSDNQNGVTAGYTEILGVRFNTSGYLGVSDGRARAFPAWATIPSGQNLAFGRVVHFFFAWLLVGALATWFATSVANRHLQTDLVPTTADLRALPQDIRDHLRLRFQHGRHYSVLQKLAYGGVLFILLPLMIATGLAMSPGVNAAVPWLSEMLGGRQTARTLHFLTMLALTGFFAIHMAMILVAGPFNELRSIITGWYRADTLEEDDV